MADRRLLTPQALDDLRLYTQLPDRSLHERLARPYSTSASKPALCRHKAVLRGDLYSQPVALPPLRHAPAPSEMLRGHTVSEALRNFPEPPSEFPCRLQFGPSVSPFLASASHATLGDRAMASYGSIASYRSMLQSSSGASSLRRTRSTPQIRRGRAAMLSGGAPLNSESAASLRSLQIKLLEKLSPR